MGEQHPIDNVDQLNTQRPRFIIAFVAFLFLFVFLFGLPFAAFSDETLFEPVDGLMTTQVVPVGARRVRAVQVNWSALTPRVDELHLNLFDDVNLTAQFSRADSSATGAYVWVGEVIGEPGSAVTLAVQDGVLSGSVHRFGRQWVVIEYAGGANLDLYTIREIDPNTPQPTGPDYVVAPQSAADNDTRSSQTATCQEDGSKISLLIAYTAQARDMVGGTQAIIALINRRISEMNTANDVSRVDFDWVLADVEEVDYTESGNIGSDLGNLAGRTDGHMDNIHASRDATKADLVALLISQGSDGRCGLANQLLTAQPNPEIAFGVTALDYPGDYLCDELTLTHELGHNLGNAHDRFSAGNNGVFPYSYGFQSPQNTFRTLMAYNCPNGGCLRINQWANPAVWYQNEPTGIDFGMDPDNASDVARSMNETRFMISNYRADCIDLTPTSTATASPTATATPTNTATATLTATPTSTATVASTATNTPTATSTPPGPTVTPTRTRRPTATPEPTATPTRDTESHTLFAPLVIHR